MISPKAAIAIAMEARRLIKNWPMYIIQLGLPWTREVLYSLRDGTAYVTRRRTGDISTILDISGRHLYNPPGFEIADDDVVFDIGAHIGVFAVFAAARARSGKVIAFEPESNNLSLLLRNLALNRADNVVPFGCAVSGYEGRRTMFLSDDSLSHSLTKDLVSGRQVGEVTVETLSLEGVIKMLGIPKIDFMKMNCEGGEYEILESCSTETMSKIRRIVVQYHDIDSARNGVSLKGSLESKGYSVRIAPTDLCHVLYAHRN